MEIYTPAAPSKLSLTPLESLQMQQPFYILIRYWKPWATKQWET